MSPSHQVSEESAGSVLIVGAGLMGTSLGLALTGAGWRVWLDDIDPGAVALAAALGAGAAALPSTEPDLVFVAAPPGDVAETVEALSRRYVQSTFSDLASVKSRVQVEVHALLPQFDRFVGGHPMAGRERSGAGAARGDLFEGRPWVLCPTQSTDPARLEQLERVALQCGAVPIVMTPERHDEAVALVSHVPQIAASLVAARLGRADVDLLALAGQGVMDTTRIAASDPTLWAAIVDANATAVLAVLDGLGADLGEVRDELARSVEHLESMERLDDVSTIRGSGLDPTERDGLLELFERGNKGRARLPGKHGGAATAFMAVPVVVPDRPGELGRLFVAAGEAGVNIEDVAIEHSKGQPVGLVELSVRPETAQRLADALSAAGWSVHL